MIDEEIEKNIPEELKNIEITEIEEILSKNMAIQWPLIRRLQGR